LVGEELCLIEELKLAPLGIVSVVNSWSFKTTWQNLVKDLFHSVSTLTILKIKLIAGFWSVLVRSWEGVGGGGFVVVGNILSPHNLIEIVCLISNGWKHVFVICTAINVNLCILKVFQRGNRFLLIIFLSAGDKYFVLNDVNILELGSGAVPSTIVIHTSKWSTGGDANALK
jgi:hypothetical protein